VTPYAQAIAYLQGLEVSKGWDLKLERMRAALALRAHPERRFRTLHVAGTNGKGSTAAMLEAVLRASGRRTGLYTSPHLVDFAERMRAGGLAAPHDTIVELVAELRTALAAAAIELTHFEFSTLLAFEWFARIGVEVAVVEVGLGGRLDATNLVAPLVTAITSIGRDHEEFLGSDVAGIAREKAGIAKPGVPLVVGPVAPDLGAVIRAHADAVGAPVVSAIDDASLVETAEGLVYRGPGDVAWDRLRLSLAGRFQRANARTALTVLACARAGFPVSAPAVREGLATTWWPGRLAVLREGPRVVADGAHNPDGTAALVAELPALLGARPTTLVFSVMADKAWRTMLDLLVPYAARVVATRVGRRGLDPALVAEALAGRMSVDVVSDAPAAIRGALAAAPPDGAVLIAGSLFLVGEAYAVLGDGAPLVAPWQGWDRIGTQARP
jgi:dihydrofolate synthase/folylpolyglutamate synthase